MASEGRHFDFEPRSLVEEKRHQPQTGNALEFELRTEAGFGGRDNEVGKEVDMDI